MYERNIKKRNKKRSSGYHRGRSAVRHSHKRTLFMAAAAIIGIVYAGIGLGYRKAFFPNTVVNGFDVSGMNLEQVKAALDSEIKQYVLTIEKRDGIEEIHGDEFDLYAEYDRTLEGVLEEQNPFAWGIHYIKGNQYEIKPKVFFDEKKLTKVINSLACLDPGQVEFPVDAHLAYVEGSGLQIVPEVRGNELKQGEVIEKIWEDVCSLKNRISLEELGLYKEPELFKDSPVLKERVTTWKPYTDVTVIYRFGSRTEILDGSILYQWMSDDGQGHVLINEEKAAEYVKNLAKKYNTAYCAKELKTSSGPTVTITSGYYGWMIDQKAETEALMDIIYSGESQEREPIYLQTAASHDGPDYGDTYAELDLTSQHLYFYKNGELLVESDFVSGNEARGWSTPAGAFSLTYKQRNAVLKGKNYATPVNYWMPFDGNIGMHDGYWRSEFGGTIYKKNGSHGCVNLPPDVAKTIYENIETGIPVLCYQLDS